MVAIYLTTIINLALLEAACLDWIIAQQSAASGQSSQYSIFGGLNH
jgi:hypothetical protein